MRQWWSVPGETGGYSELRDVPVPEPGAGEVRVTVKATAINRGELIGRPKLLSSNPKLRAAPSGIEFAGTVSALGDHVNGWALGARVMGRATACHADEVIVDARALMRIPSDLPFDAAAAIPNVFVTAHDALVGAAGIRSGDQVLVTAGSSGVGSAAIQIAAHLGAGSVIATTRSPDKQQALVSLGASSVIDTRTDDWWKTVLDESGGVDIVIDQVAGELVPACLRSMAIGGRFVSVGRNGGQFASVDLDLVALRRLSIIGVTFRTRTREEALACSERFATQLLPAFDTGALHPVVEQRFALDDLAKAHDLMASDRQVGKIVLVT